MQDLGLVGIRDMGNYDPTVTYQTGHFIYWEGSTYKVLRDNVRGITPSNDGINYGFLARGFLGADAEDITITDTYGEVVTAGGKTLVQRIIDHIISSFVKKEDLSSSNTITTKKEYAADAWQLNHENEGSYAKSVASQIDDCVKKEDLSSSGTVTTPKQYAADAWQLNPVNEGSYANSVATQIDDLANQDSDLINGITIPYKVEMQVANEAAFLEAIHDQIATDVASHKIDVGYRYGSVTRIYTWVGNNYYIVHAFGVTTQWMYSLTFTSDKAYIISYNLTTKTISTKKTITMT